MQFNDSLIILILAGVINGSFVVPTYYIKCLSSERVWLYHSVIGLAVIPWAILLLMSPKELLQYLNLPHNTLLFILGAGFVFGIGQLCFAYAIELVGLALSFTINLGLSVTIGSIFVVLYKTVFFTRQGGLVTLAVVLILTGLVIYYFSGRYNIGRNQHAILHKSQYHQGWYLAAITGLASGLQNITFVVVVFHTVTPFKTQNSFWLWPPFLSAAAIAMFLGFLYRIKQKLKLVNTYVSLKQKVRIKNIFLIVIMGACFTGSLALYSSAMSSLSHIQQVIGWPVFMVAIILVTQGWGWLYNETNRATFKCKCYMFASAIFLIAAIMVLASVN